VLKTVGNMVMLGGKTRLARLNRRGSHALECLDGTMERLNTAVQRMYCTKIGWVFRVSRYDYMQEDDTKNCGNNLAYLARMVNCVHGCVGGAVQ